MDYGSEIWNFVITDNNDNLHCKFCKFTLGVSTNATNLAVYGELGNTPLSICRKVQVVNIGRDYVMKMRIYLSI